MRRAVVEEFCEIVAPEEPILLADNNDRAFIGVAFVNHTAIAVYDQERTIDGIMQDSGMSAEDAQEFFDFNVAGAYVGERTPAFMFPISPQLNWRELDILIMYINDDPKRFIEHIAEFGYTQREARSVKKDIVETLATQAVRIA